ncbi:MAG: hydrogenase maturation protein HypF [Blastocatellia bacterium]|jgi:hydrogenase maturation protein HypF|nr:hydrogenase maturation protein HypF [Blastocatellia bacterium]
MVQSVGFRPFVYALAKRHGLNGQVLNNERGVLIDLEGDAGAIDQFAVDLEKTPPPLSRIESIERQDQLEPANYDDFRVVESTVEGERLIPIPPDVATCGDCLRELFDPHDRRFRYPLINCTNCGPRFTIIEDVPYDRAKTTMREFEMCADCRAEYENPLDRRFHAEPIACAQCGPQVSLIQNSSKAESLALGDAAINETIRLLQSGKIVAVKGIGGYHLVCDALNEQAVSTLRLRKYREDKPFALMAPSIEVVEEYCSLSEAEKELLLSPARPIVLLERRPEASIPESVAPRVTSLGFMLPYSPIQHLLFEKLSRPLVMTSANVSDEPICYEDDDALKRLTKIADYYLVHDRRIHMRTDDSVVRVIGNKCGRDVRAPSMIVRRSRGYAPGSIKTGVNFERQILACGAELKNTFCLAREQYAFVSQHIGDLENLETLRSFTEGIEHFQRLFHLDPEVIAYDLHPEYLSTKYAREQDKIETKLGVQHHHAHIASCMADNQLHGELIGVAMDGLGFGSDGRLWGGEFFVADFVRAERIAHLDYMPMPGGAKAIREPWRMAAVYLQKVFGDEFTKLELPFVAEMNAKSWLTLKSMIETKTNCPETSSMGRLFDAVSSLLRLRDATNYEGQAAIELEQIADRDCQKGYQFDVSADGSIIRAQNVIRSAVEDLLDGVPPRTISAKFHLAVADLIAMISRRVREERKLNRVALSGGVFQNLLLSRLAVEKLRADGFEVFTHQRVPANDGGISLGQAAIANALIAAGKT